MNQVDTQGAWEDIWGGITGAWDGLTGLLNIIAVLLLVAAFIQWVWQRRKNIGSGNNSGLIGTFVVALLFLAPQLIIPFALTIFDALANFVLGIFA